MYTRQQLIDIILMQMRVIFDKIEQDLPPHVVWEMNNTHIENAHARVDDVNAIFTRFVVNLWDKTEGIHHSESQCPIYGCREFTDLTSAYLRSPQEYYRNGDHWKSLRPIAEKIVDSNWEYYLNAQREAGTAQAACQYVVDVLTPNSTPRQIETVLKRCRKVLTTYKQ